MKWIPITEKRPGYGQITLWLKTMAANGLEGRAVGTFFDADPDGRESADHWKFYGASMWNIKWSSAPTLSENVVAWLEEETVPVMVKFYDDLEVSIEESHLKKANGFSAKDGVLAIFFDSEVDREVLTYTAPNISLAADVKQLKALGLKRIEGGE